MLEGVREVERHLFIPPLENFYTIPLYALPIHTITSISYPVLYPTQSYTTIYTLYTDTYSITY